jgi:hypothetical protein
VTDQPSRFHASPAQIDAFLRQNFAEDVLLNFYRAAGDEVLDEVRTSAQTFKSLKAQGQAKHAYLAAIDDTMDYVWDDRYFPAKLPNLATYDRPFNLPRTVQDWGREFLPCTKCGGPPEDHIGWDRRHLYTTASPDPAPTADVPSPCYRKKVHEPHKWLKGRRAVQCPGHPIEENPDV